MSEKEGLTGESGLSSSQGAAAAAAGSKQGHDVRVQRDSGYMSVTSASETPRFQVGPDAGQETDETFTFDEDEELLQGASGLSITDDVFSAMDSTHGHHHPYDILTPLSPESDSDSSCSKPIDIPSRSSHRAQRHDHFTPPRGYIQACHRYSTGSIPSVQIQRSTSVHTQTSGSSVETAGRDLVDNAIRFHEGLLLHTEEKLLQKGRVVRRPRYISEGPLASQVDEETALAAGPSRGRSQSVPIMAQSDLQKLYGQELRRIADEFHCTSNCLEELYPAPNTTHVRHHSASYPRMGHQRGWWQHIIQFISPRRRPRVMSTPRSSSSVTDDPLLESEID